MRKGQTLCLICCYSFKSTFQSIDPEGRDAPEADNDDIGGEEGQVFKLFCEQLEGTGAVSKDALEGNTLVAKSFLGLLDSESCKGKLAVCPDCLKLISGAMELRLKAEEVECRVRKLQKQILGELKQLHRHMGGFYGELKKIEGTVRSSDGNCLECCVERVVGGEIGRGLKSDLVLFRRKIFEVARDLEMHQSCVDKVLLIKPSVEADRDLRRQTKVNKTKTQGRNISMLKVETVDPPPGCRGDDLNDTSVWAKEGLPLQIKIEEEEEDVHFRSEGVTEEDALQSGTKTSFANLPGTAKVDEDFEPADIDLEESDTGSNYSDEQPMNPLPSKRTRMRNITTSLAMTGSKRPSPKKLARKPVGEKSKKLCPTEPTSSVSQPSSKLKEIKSSVDFSKMEPFKKGVVWRALKRQATREEQAAGEVALGELDIEVEYDPRRLYYLKYVKEEDRLAIGNIEILINEQARRLQCSLCPYAPNPVEKSGKLTRGNDMERYLFKHVLSKHMAVFECPLCGSNFKCEWRYKEHLRGHKGLEAKVCCDICARPCSSNHVMQLHRWTHMSEEEKAESIRNGEKDPRLKHKQYRDRLANVRYPCPHCGKSFGTEANLQQHEKIHDKASRDQVICQDCGKKMLRVSYDSYHKNYACPGKNVGILPRVKCLYCDVTFKNVIFMRRHLARKHSSAVEERPVKCDICNKGFKTKDCLWNHRQTHNEVELTCGKGCGRGFRTKKNRKRHEDKCKGDQKWAGEQETGGEVGGNQQGQVISLEEGNGQVEIPILLMGEGMLELDQHNS